MKKLIFSISSMLLVFSFDAYSQELALKSFFTIQGVFADSTIELLETKQEATIFFSSIHAEKRQRGIRIVWSTNTKSNNRYFVIERSADGNSFEPIGSYKELRTRRKHKSYVFIDEEPLAVRSYYRIKQVNFKEGHKVSAITIFKI